MFAVNENYFNSLTCQGSGHGYYPKPSNSILIVHPENLKAGKEFGARNGFKVCMGTRYLGGYIGDDESKSDWLRERTLKWDKKINRISATAGKYTQEIYASVVRAIQSEWIFLQHVTWDTGDAFTGVKKMIQENVLPHLFFRKTKTLSPIVVTLSTMPIKVAGLGLLNKLTPEKEK